MESKNVRCWRCGKTIWTDIGGILSSGEARHITIANWNKNEVVKANLCGKCGDDMLDYLRFGPRSSLRDKERK